MKLLSVEEVKELRRTGTRDHATFQRMCDTLEASLKVVEATEDYQRECENTVPDAIYKKTLRNWLFEALKPFQCGGRE